MNLLHLLMVKLVVFHLCTKLKVLSFFLSNLIRKTSMFAICLNSLSAVVRIRVRILLAFSSFNNRPRLFSTLSLSQKLINAFGIKCRLKLYQTAILGYLCSVECVK